MGRLNNVAEVPLVPASVDLPKFLWPPLTSLEYELKLGVEPIPELEPLLKYIPLPKLEPMSLDLPPLEPIIPEVPIIEISSLDSPILAIEPLQASDS